MGGIKPLIILAMAPFHLPIVSGRKRSNDLVPDTMLFQMVLEHGGFIPVGSETVGEFGTVVCLNAFNRTGEGFDQMLQEHGGRIRIMFFKGLHKAPAGILVNGRVLEELLSNHFAVFEAG